MANANFARFGYQQTHPDSAIDSKPPTFFDDNQSGLMENALMNADMMHEAVHVRRASFANGHTVVPPTHSHRWNQHYGQPLAIDPHSAGPFTEAHHGFVRESSQASVFGPPVQSQTWSYDRHSGTCTPTTAMNFEHPPQTAQFDVPYVQRTDSARGSFSHAASAPPFHVPEEGFMGAPQVQTPMSPHSHQDWMNMAAQEQENRPGSRRMGGGQSPPPRAAIDAHRRGDGVRKKNTRIDIPNERSLENIEQLIENTHDEELLKELKQQKRLLRNREAALASRQRKKKHTEDLESQQKDYSHQLSHLQQQLDALHLQRQTFDHNYQILNHRLQEALNDIEGLKQEKKDLIVNHSKETATLRKRIHVLTDQVENSPAPAMSAQPSNTSYTDFSLEMEALDMNHEWDPELIYMNSNALDEFNYDIKSEQSNPPAVEQTNDQRSLLPPSSNRASDSSAAETQVTSGLLFFLLLCGALVASKPASSQPPDLPHVPPNYRAAAPSVLSNLLAESPTSATQVHSRTPLAHQSQTAMSSSRDKRSRVDNMYHQLTAPTRQQEDEAAFSLTPAQYASLTMDYTGDDERNSDDHLDSTPRPRRRLGEMLANMQEEHTRNSKAEVYTRSLLWDQIPADVVRQFKEFSRDHNAIEARQRETNDDEMTAYKVES